MPKLRFLLACAFAVAAIAPVRAQSNSKGTLFIIGGGPQPTELVQQFVDLAGGRGKARIVIFAQASVDGARSGEEKAAELRALGAAAVVGGTSPGFGLIANAIVDQHFLRRKRHNRLMSLVLEQAPHLGAGIDESTALIVRPDGTWRVAGASTVVVYDARSATVTPSSSRVLGGSNLRAHVLPAGSTFDPRTGAAFLS